ncbi:alpha/beta hydrolase [Pseudoduganella violacea]|uniref:Serine aminopeptidase S33 domain-containing protein n=1 Tax=Pseudoduganella violacea TaxID=1715466 RepID=A0A7W5FVW5_9BURK|nr:alpha/beta hydrolase [Pseudoduganella violacea]MBB3120638.1 hypothetical protein [Pseudoduganella violacea]
MNNSRKMAAAAGMMGFVWAGLTAVVAASQRKLLFNPNVKREVRSPRSSGHRTRAVVLRAADGTKLAGWLMTPRQPGPYPAVIYFGGRSEEVSWVARDAGTLFPGMAVLAMNYRGYGESQGEPGEEHMVEDGRMLFDWLRDSANADAARIAVVGRSLGSGVAVQVAMERAVHSIVLITPYDSILALARRRFRAMPIGMVLKHRFESVKHAERLTAPTYVLRAASDDVVPHSHTDELVTRLNRLHLDETVPGTDHMNIPYLEITQRKIAQFLSTQFAQATEQAGARPAATSQVSPPAPPVLAGGAAGMLAGVAPASDIPPKQAAR